MNSVRKAAGVTINPQARRFLIQRPVPTTSRVYCATLLLHRLFSSSEPLCRASRKPHQPRAFTRAPTPDSVGPVSLEAQQQYEEYVQQQRNEQIQRTHRSIHRRAKIVVGSIIVLCVTGFVLSTVEIVRDGESVAGRMEKLLAFHRKWALSVESIRDGRYYTLITSAFMHGSLSHLGFNMWALWSFGIPIIMIYGVPRFLMTYFGSTIAGGLLQTEWTKRRNKSHEELNVGASGGIFGLLGVTACLAPRNTILLLFVPIPIGLGVSIAVIASIGGMMDKWLPGYGHADHLGGLAAGALFYGLSLRRANLGPMQSYVKAVLQARP